MKRTYKINGNEISVEYEYEGKWEVINQLPKKYVFMNDVNPEDFKFIEDQHTYNNTEVILTSEEDGILLSERIEKIFELEFIKDGETVSILKEFLKIPSADNWDDEIEFFKVTENNQLMETYQYGEEENLEHEFYWEAQDLEDQYATMNEGESKTFENWGDLPSLKLTCLRSEELYPYEESLIY